MTFKFQHHNTALIMLRKEMVTHSIVLHKSVSLSDVTVSDILHPNYLPICFHILYHVRAREV